VREVSNVEAKRAIGLRAAELVPDGATVVLSSGSTPQSVAEALLARQGLTIYSNSLVVCGKLANRNRNRVVVLGGEIQANNNSTLGHDAISVLSNYHTDFAFVGAGGISPDGWVMDYTRDEAELHRLMLRSARTAAIVADYSKFNRHAPVRVADFEKITHLVTDRPPDGPLARALAGLPLEVLLSDARPR
jgi:DeoR/GlpR family transcriptional regulator of sugar metabolism